MSKSERARKCEKTMWVSMLGAIFMLSLAIFVVQPVDKLWSVPVFCLGLLFAFIAAYYNGELIGLKYKESKLKRRNLK